MTSVFYSYVMPQKYYWWNIRRFCTSAGISLRTIDTLLRQIYVVKREKKITTTCKSYRILSIVYYIFFIFFLLSRCEDLVLGLMTSK